MCDDEQNKESLTKDIPCLECKHILCEDCGNPDSDNYGMSVFKVDKCKDFEMRW